MLLVRDDMDETIVPLDAGWELAVTEPGAFSEPAALAGAGGWIAAEVPGTAEEAL
ncbi:MAG: hypothetical protein FD152_3644, partial [Xanthobacteraceae bacterium]